ncbi:uncharacterized protein LOC131996302 [Stomoxys calcitrans]|uniref:uncharacterized protein LOC131996302 n=1 Tax=Stomoxys calcitrans TaxID=35570 RepID=UPI0027E342BB|nr:uncharacterized protein LOC131996302 [Stomoxys calcitrans]
MGDLNVRIGELRQDIGEFYTENFYAGYEVRKSKDKIINQKGKQFIQFCNDYNIFVLNGVTKGDEDGKCTYVSTMGESVNDICAVSKETLDIVNEFVVDDKVWSDHFPINLKLNMQMEKAKKMNLLPKLIWKDSRKIQYQSSLNENFDCSLSTNEEIGLTDVCKLIQLSSVPSTELYSFEPKCKWYNNNCNKARIKSFQLLNVYRKTKDSEDRKRYLSAQNHYKIVCNNSRADYYNEMASRLNYVTNSKDWWKVAREIRCHHNQAGSALTSNIFKRYFENLLNSVQKNAVIYYAPTFTEDLDLDGPIMMSELKKILQNVKINKAPGEDRVPYEFFVNGTEQLHKQLLRIYNKIYTEGTADPTFTKTIIYPIYKKGDNNDPSNYRGISFMNCVAKIFMGVLNERLYNWVEKYGILTEFQAGFRKKYSTVDNIYNLSTVISLKLGEKRKVYAFFVDFKAAFDNISRQALIYKLFQLGVSHKMVSMIESIYNKTQSAAWDGYELSEYFDTTKGVKQGCLLSPLLFSLYINDLYEYLEGGIFVENLNLRLLLYADDIVLLADDVHVLQNMIHNLEIYCNTWNLEVNLSKSEIMVFRNGGRLAKHEKWKFNGNVIKITNEYKYLGVIFTPKMTFTKHIQNRNNQAKIAINATWKNFVGRTDINMNAKWKLFLAVCRSIQTYAAQVWGFCHFEEVDSLQRYFLKRILKLPVCTPNYVLMLETEVEDTHIYTLGLHLKYIGKTLFQHSGARLTNQLSNIALRRNVFWVKELKSLAASMDIQWPEAFPSSSLWIHRKTESQQRIYKYLDPNKAYLYLNERYTSENITWIFKARSGMISLGYNNFEENESEKMCKLCNLRETETLDHFLGICPVLREFRLAAFSKASLSFVEVLHILDGIEVGNWDKLTTYLRMAYNYRQLLLNEYH